MSKHVSHLQFQLLKYTKRTNGVGGRNVTGLNALEHAVPDAAVGDHGQVEIQRLLAGVGAVDAVVERELGVGGQHVVLEAGVEEGDGRGGPLQRVQRWRAGEDAGVRFRFSCHGRLGSA